MRVDVLTSINSASEANRAEHEATRAEMERVRKEAEAQVEQLKEEIRLLKLDLAESVKTVVECVGRVSLREQKKLQETSNAKFSLWVAKEIILKKLLVCYMQVSGHKKFVGLTFAFRISSQCSNSTLRKSGHAQWSLDHGNLSPIQSLEVNLKSQRIPEYRVRKHLSLASHLLSLSQSLLETYT